MQMFHEYSSSVMGKRQLQGVTIPRDAKGKAADRAHARRSRLKRELTEERARWRNGRRMSQFKRAATIYCVLERNERTRNSIRKRCTDHIDLRCRRSQILFLLRILAFADHVTKRAGMCAIERLSNRLTQRRALGVINHHRRPRERLQSDPMQTNRSNIKCHCVESETKQDRCSSYKTYERIRSQFYAPSSARDNG